MKKKTLLLMGGIKKVNYTILDRFTTTESAPLTSPRTSEPGPGIFNIIDTENKLSISGGALVCGGGKTSPAFGDPGLRGSVALTRKNGLASYFKFMSPNPAYFQVGFSLTTTGTCTESSFYNQGADLTVRNNNVSTSTTKTLALNTTYELVTVLLDAGAKHYIKGGAFADWTLLNSSTAGTASTVYFALANYDSLFTCYDFILAQLPSNWSINTLNKINPT